MYHIMYLVSVAFFGRVWGLFGFDWILGLDMEGTRIERGAFWHEAVLW